MYKKLEDRISELDGKQANRKSRLIAELVNTRDKLTNAIDELVGEEDEPEKLRAEMATWLMGKVSTLLADAPDAELQGRLAGLADDFGDKLDDRIGRRGTR